MLSRRIVRASPFVAARRLPVMQRRTFMPEAMVGQKIIEEKYPSSDYPNLTAAEDPEMVGVAVRGWRTGR